MLPLDPQQIEELSSIGRRYDLKLIVLHGSYATGKAHSHSDLDMAVLGKNEIEREKFLNLHSEVFELLGNHPERDLDLKTLHRKDPLFLYEVMRDSKLLYGNPSDYHQLKAYAYRLYQDSRDLRRLENLLAHRLLERIKSDVGL